MGRGVSQYHNKRACQMRHFKDRMYERYGLRISTDACRAIVRAIQNGTAQQIRIHGMQLDVSAAFLERQSLRLTIWALRISGLKGEIRAVYDSTRQSLVTAHPRLAPRKET